MDSLRDPDQTPEDLLNVMTLKRADGREVSLQEFSMTYLLGIGETLRAEEIVLRAPDGRSVTVLLNATPILSDGGSVDSMVVTMQDMADVVETERLRAEFLSMVSHELRERASPPSRDPPSTCESPWTPSTGRKCSSSSASSSPSPTGCGTS